jgi:hypothetical protein
VFDNLHYLIIRLLLSPGTGPVMFFHHTDWKKSYRNLQFSREIYRNNSHFVLSGIIAYNRCAFTGVLYCDCLRQHYIKVCVNCFKMAGIKVVFHKNKGMWSCQTGDLRFFYQRSHTLRYFVSSGRQNRV